jgi:hypothetical protein
MRQRRKPTLVLDAESAKALQTPEGLEAFLREHFELYWRGPAPFGIWSTEPMADLPKPARETPENRAKINEYLQRESERYREEMRQQSERAEPPGLPSAPPFPDDDYEKTR